ncbi:citrate lyase subunit beta/citryl-CoA lyase [Nocardioides sp. J9]|uniref:HpcH/HpaI aldolase/citrate lyase family protein n=1 Tax=Nocardioides sp. J9 TaxID=935844 RepID=UPI0011A3DD9A|nr:CoA ester lyase [Nocardioides sp. J9]TWG94936.1 citrate lyase subunit beta/citryl-CoA lyase [Nocardioides sp. J9]
MTVVNVALVTRRASLCVPAGDDRKLHKALESGVDEVVVDLEDAVAVDDKERAREQLGAFSWPEDRPRVVVRVNAIGSPWCHRDLEAVAGIDAISAVVLPKVESRADVEFVERLLDGLEVELGRREPLAVQALVETAAGVLRLGDVVAGPKRLEALVVGYADLGASLGRSRALDQVAWRGIQDAFVLHARAAGVAAIDGPFLGVADDEPFRTAVADAAALGFDAKWVIHPRQAAAVTEAFTPSPEQVDHARRVLQTLDEAAAAGRGAAVVDGALVDEAMAKDARHVLARAGAR